MAEKLIGQINYGNRGPRGERGVDGLPGRDGYVQYTAGENINISEDNVISSTGGVSQEYVDSEVARVEAEIPTVPTNVSAFTNDAGYLTQHQSLDGYATENYVDNEVADLEQAINEKQDALTAGSGIDITNNVISATSQAPDIDNKTIVMNSDGELETKIGGWVEENFVALEFEGYFDGNIHITESQLLHTFWNSLKLMEEYTFKAIQNDTEVNLKLRCVRNYQGIDGYKEFQYYNTDAEEIWYGNYGAELYGWSIENINDWFSEFNYEDPIQLIFSTPLDLSVYHKISPKFIELGNDSLPLYTYNDHQGYTQNNSGIKWDAGDDYYEAGYKLDVHKNGNTNFINFFVSDGLYLDVNVDKESFSTDPQGYLKSNIPGGFDIEMFKAEQEEIMPIQWIDATSDQFKTNFIDNIFDNYSVGDWVGSFEYWRKNFDSDDYWLWSTPGGYIHEETVDDVYRKWVYAEFIEFGYTIENDVKTYYFRYYVENGTINGIKILYENSTIVKPIPAEYISIDNNTITINGDGKLQASGGGGSSYIAGNGIDITNDVISVDNTIALKSELPTATSELTNDSGFITAGDIPAIPTNTSDLTNDSGFITSSYHDSTKQDVLTAGTNISIVDNVISAIGGAPSNMVTTDTDQIITGTKTIGELKFYQGGDNLNPSITNIQYGSPSPYLICNAQEFQLYFNTESSENGTFIVDIANNIISGKDNTDLYTLGGPGGSSSYKPFNTLYCNNLSDGTTTKSMTEVLGSGSLWVKDEDEHEIKLKSGLFYNVALPSGRSLLLGDGGDYGALVNGGGLTVYDEDPGTTTQYSYNAIKYKGAGQSDFAILSLPTQSGTLALTSDIPTIPTIPTKTSDLTNDSGFITNSALSGYATQLYVNNATVNKLNASKCTYQTTAPTSSISDGGVHIVYLTSEPATKYNGYIYLIKE